MNRTSAPAGSYLYYRHKLPVRVMHWINVVALTILFMSGLQIFNAHAQLYWGKSSYDGTPPLLTISSRQDAQGAVTGYARVLGHEFDTTGVLGRVQAANGRWVRAAFPSWITIPSMKWLSMARSWHFFFAWVFVLNGIAFVVYAILSRHLARDLAPTRSDLKGIGASIGTTFASGTRRARRPSVTTCCRSWPTSSSSSSCCRWSS